jgi:putative transposase
MKVVLIFSRLAQCYRSGAAGKPSPNDLECLNREVKRRTRVATHFANEDSLLRLATAVLMETDEEWQTEKRYLPKKNP